MSREGKLAQNTLILSIGTFLPKFAALVTLPILTGYLTKEEMGTYDLVTVLVSLILPSATLKLPLTNPFSPRKIQASEKIIVYSSKPPCQTL